MIDVSASLGYGVQLDLDALRVNALRVDVGASVHLSGVLPALRVEVAVEGEAVARIAGFPLATARVRGGQVSFEIGLRLGPDGEFASDTWISGDGSLIDVDVHWAAALAAGVVSPAGALTAAVVLELVESSMNDLITSKVQRLAAGGLRGVRHAFARFLGGDSPTSRSGSTRTTWCWPTWRRSNSSRRRHRSTAPSTVARSSGSTTAGRWRRTSAATPRPATGCATRSTTSSW